MPDTSVAQPPTQFVPTADGLPTTPAAAPATTINPSSNPNIQVPQTGTIQTNNAGLTQAAKDAQAKQESLRGQPC